MSSRFFLCSILFLCLMAFPFPVAAGIPPGPSLPAILYMEELPASTAPGPRAPVPPRITADAAVLMDAATGQVLYAKNPHQPRPPASTTKILTALLALEGGRLDQVVTVSPEAAAVGESSMHLFPGEKMTLEQLLYGALLRSGNDACVAIAEHIAGNVNNFVWLMNRKARELGARHTHFVNPNGLPAAGHLSTAYDLALLTRYALRNHNFQRMVATRYHGFGVPHYGEYHLHNTNRLLWSYRGADGVKTGTTSAAGMCLVASASRDGRQLITVVLHSDDRYGDTMALLDYGFAAFKNTTLITRGQVCARAAVVDGMVPEVSLVSDRNVEVTLPVKADPIIEKRPGPAPPLQAPVQAGIPVNSLEIWVDRQPAARALLLTARSVERLPFYRLWWQRWRGINSPPAGLRGFSGQPANISIYVF
ncbi:MAG TPA: D-alanyl-D-alanine carboxypeptidase [Desulfotomaculum sp.]|nr:D-alanyl-D-alanine carboxypeptidase [Desulfotomaculum sp.]